MAVKEQGVTFDLPPRYRFFKMLGSGGFGHVASAFDTRTVLQHQYQGDGRKRAFKVSFRHIGPGDANSVAATVGGHRAAFRLSTPPGDVWPLYVEFQEPPPAGAAVRIRTYELVAVKRVTEVFSDVMHCKYALRELKLLRFFDHPNIISLRDVFRAPSASHDKWNDLYLVTELMDNNLRVIVKSEQPIGEDHASYFMYQLLCGVKEMHDAGIIHRDLKPHNLLVNMDCELKICDFGMARAEDTTVDMSDDVQTIWYRAPEILVDCAAYSKPIDLWSCGTILGELLGRRALFMGRHSLQMLQLIIQMLGSPSEEDLFFKETTNKTREYIRKLRAPPANWSRLFPRASALGLDLLSKLLVFNPAKRLTIEEALNHPFCKLYCGGEEDEAPAVPDALDAASGVTAADVGARLPAEQREEVRRLVRTMADACAAQLPAGEQLVLLAEATPRLLQLCPTTADSLQRLGWHNGTYEKLNATALADYLKKLDVVACKMDTEAHEARRPRAQESAGRPQFDDRFEDDFKMPAPQHEGAVVRHARELLHREISDFQRAHGAATPPPMAARFGPKREGQLPPLLPPEGGDDITLIELTDVPYTPVTPVDGNSWGDGVPG
eukprot:TRINITY_DN4079_c0_g1_i1.p1 TRINITY_DN4079_c0_g1~~TRINITY_DN4079_c0_g1_i1.p1  ORF type:complete len:624 (+),score=193.23 TRINITY_DN4079_c0_g1_i1:46-1872(+)